MGIKIIIRRNIRNNKNNKNDLTQSSLSFGISVIFFVWCLFDSVLLGGGNHLLPFWSPLSSLPPSCLVPRKANFSHLRCDLPLEKDHLGTSSCVLPVAVDVVLHIIDVFFLLSLFLFLVFVLHLLVIQL